MSSKPSTSLEDVVGLLEYAIEILENKKGHNSKIVLIRSKAAVQDAKQILEQIKALV